MDFIKGVERGWGESNPHDRAGVGGADLLSSSEGSSGGGAQASEVRGRPFESSAYARNTPLKRIY